MDFIYYTFYFFFFLIHWSLRQNAGQVGEAANH